MELPKIAVVGGGPAGLTLARLLQNAQMACTLFERDVSRDARSPHLQGTLDLHTATGQEALKQAGLLSKFEELSRPEGELFKLVDSKTLDLHFIKYPPEKGNPNKPEIMRTDLREILLDSLHSDSIKWDKKLIEVKQSDGEVYDLYFQDGSVEKGFDLVVGADGAFSKVRLLVSSEPAHYCGITYIQVETPVSEVRKDVSDLIEDGAVLTSRDHKAIWGQRLSSPGNIFAALMLSVPETWIKDSGIDFADADGARKALVEKYMDKEGWSETIREIVLGSKGMVTPRHIWELPVGFKWETRRGIALTGDSAHVMGPFAGVGVNLAMEDALDLARSIIKRKHEGKKAIVEDAIKEYEQLMFVRAEENATLTKQNMDRTFFDGSGEIVI